MTHKLFLNSCTSQIQLLAYFSAGGGGRAHVVYADVRGPREQCGRASRRRMGAGAHGRTRVTRRVIRASLRLAAGSRRRAPVSAAGRTTGHNGNEDTLRKKKQNNERVTFAFMWSLYKFSKI